jgi:hypothetical protein
MFHSAEVEAEQVQLAMQKSPVRPFFRPHGAPRMVLKLVTE